MVIKKNILSKEEGREAFIEKIKLLGINDKDSLKNLSKFYNLCWAKVYEGNDRENTNVLFECNSQEAGEAVLSVIENTLVEQGIFKNSEIGTRFLKKQEDVDVVIQILRDEKLYSNYKTVIVACYKEEYAKNNKGVLNAVQLLKDADGNNGIFQRKLSIHININIDSADIYTSEVMTRLERVRKCTDEFKEGIRKYIHNLPSKEEREVKDDEAFITDIENRVFQFYYSQDNLGEMFDENCVPHYETVEEIVESEEEAVEKPIEELVEEIVESEEETVEKPIEELLEEIVESEEAVVEAALEAIEGQLKKLKIKNEESIKALKEFFESCLKKAGYNKAHKNILLECDTKYSGILVMDTLNSEIKKYLGDKYIHTEFIDNDYDKNENKISNNLKNLFKENESTNLILAYKDKNVLNEVLKQNKVDRAVFDKKPIDIQVEIEDLKKFKDENEIKIKPDDKKIYVQKTDKEKDSKIKSHELKVNQIKNVLILGMSTLPCKNTLSVNTYKYNDKKVYGYGQMDPIPQMLDEEIKDGNIDLIIITASNKAVEQINKSVYYDKESKLCKESDKENTVNYKCSAVELFKYHMMNKFRGNILFKTIEIEENNVDKSVYELTNLIRNLNIKTEDDTSEQKIRFYMDIHGGLRETQTLFDAAITVLGIENIEMEKVFTCNFEEKEKINKIKEVTDQFQIFKFVSGVDDFINHGSSFEIKNYVDKCNDGNQDNRKQLVKAIKQISDALLLCKVEGFEKALDNLNNNINIGFENDYLFKILADIIKSDYGKLLEKAKKERSLYDEIKWAKNKDLYQQALTLIEAKTPKFILDNYLNINSICYKKNNSKVYAKIFREKVRSFPDEKLDSILYRTMFFENGRNNKMYIDKEEGVLHYQYSKNDDDYSVAVKLKTKVNESEFKELGAIWWYIKKEIRNNIAHSNDSELNKLVKDSKFEDNNNIIVVSDKIDEYLEQLQKLMCDLEKNKKENLVESSASEKTANRKSNITPKRSDVPKKKKNKKSNSGMKKSASSDSEYNIMSDALKNVTL